MKSANHEQALGIPISSIRFAAEINASLSLQCTSYEHAQYKSQKEVDSLIAWMGRFRKKADKYVEGIKNHVSLGAKISETVKGKLSLGAKILQAGGVERVFRRSFSADKGEKLLKAFQCYLSTTAGPISGLLFVSTSKIAFRSDRSLRVTSAEGRYARSVPYKVLIPVGRVERVGMREDCDKPNQKYIQIVTVDKFEFWFMGFLCSQRSLKYLRRATSSSSSSRSQEQDGVVSSAVIR